MPAKAKTITFNGESLTAKQWGERLGLSRQAVLVRLNSGWSLEQALTLPNGHDGREKIVKAARAEATRSQRIRNADAKLLNREFEKLVREIDRALNAFNQVLRHFEVSTEATPGVGSDLSKSAHDRSIPSAQDLT